MYSVGYERFKGHAPGEQPGGRVRVTGVHAPQPSTTPTRPTSTVVEPSSGIQLHQEGLAIPEASPEAHADISEGTKVQDSAESQPEVGAYTDQEMVEQDQKH